MKTAEEIQKEIDSYSDKNKRSFDNGFKCGYAEAVKDFETYKKSYALQVAEQTLKDAAENAEVDHYDWDRSRVDKDSILNTEIKLP